ncbi:uncharacterized protein LOC135835878 [Planococcus citri]|uniref:uncharacterized protein LOC135835878 n=1 Tax=Planococcus citri TaxID=170843 RepID=UPI0031F9369B
METSEIPPYTIFTVDSTELDVDVTQVPSPQPKYSSADDPLLTDVWIGLILILMVLICIGYICTCLLYHKFRRWKQEVLQAQRAMNTRVPFREEYTYEESLPSYTIVTGLPSYDQAMEQFRKIRTMRRVSSPKLGPDEDRPPKLTFARLSLGDIFQFYKNDKTLPV